MFHLMKSLMGEDIADQKNLSNSGDVSTTVTPIDLPLRGDGWHFILKCVREEFRRSIGEGRRGRRC
jgi:hypothetical protein